MHLYRFTLQLSGVSVVFSVAFSVAFSAPSELGELMKMKRVFLILALILAGCSASTKPDAVSETPIRSAIIFVPGYYGSTLKEKANGDRFFITAGNYLFGSKALSLHNADLLTPPAPELELEGILEGVRLIPGIYTVDVYGQFLDHLREYTKRTHQELVPFAYDWRQDLPETASRLAQMVKELRARGITRIQIVAHSMGCLITTYYLAYGDQKLETAMLNWAGANQVERAVLMAGPYRGAFSLFRNMQTGAKIGSNSSYMPAETVASFPASYQLLPFRDMHLLDASGQLLDFPLSDVASWDLYEIGLLHDRSFAVGVRDRRYRFLDHELRRASQFSKLLTLPADPLRPPPSSLKILQLVGYGHSVVDSGYWNRQQDGFHFDTGPLKELKLAAAPLFMDGDGSVTVRSAQLPPALVNNSKVLHTKWIHDKIFEDPDFWEELKKFLD